MKVRIPAIDLIFNGHIDQIEKYYMASFLESGEKDLNYLNAWAVCRTVLEENAPLFANNIVFLTKPFMDLVEKNTGSILDAYKVEILNGNSDILNFSGLVFDQSVGCFLELDNDRVSFLLFNKDVGIPYITGETYYDVKNSMVNSNYSLFLSKHIKYVDEFIINYVLRFVFSIILEKLIVEKEIVIVPPHGRKKTSQDKYINENKTGIKIWDSRKFNSYVRLDGFSVTGHFRHQRVGNGRNGHRLIWINEFQKHGYNRNKLTTKIKGIHEVGIN